jgi:hypothetical protein
MHIHYDPLELLQRQCVDMAVHQAVNELGQQFDDKGALHRVATAAAQAAISTFAGHCNAQLAMIRAHYDAKLQEAHLRVPTPITLQTGDTTNAR